MSYRKSKRSASIPPLVDELLLSCFARVSRLNYPTLSLVSKRFRSLLSSPELYKARSLLGHTERSLYICLDLGSVPSRDSSWYTLFPNRTLTNKSTGYTLTAVKIPDSPLLRPSGLVVVGTDIYNIGWSAYNRFASNVSVLDCRSHTWREAPSLRFEMRSLSASVDDGKIYVAGSYNDDEGSSKDSFEVFDTNTQTWDTLPYPSIRKESNHNPKTFSVDGKFHVVNRMEVVAYSHKESRWNMVGKMVCSDMDSDIYCVINDILYAALGTSLVWYDSEVGQWRKLEGLAGLPYVIIRNFFRSRAYLGMADYGGKMVVLWYEPLPYTDSSDYYNPTLMIMCAVIVLGKHKSWKMWGKVEWSGCVLTVPTKFEFKKVLAVTL